MSENKKVLKGVQAFVKDIFKKELPKNYLYHDIGHTKNVAKDARLIGTGNGLAEEEVEILEIAAWLHDVGYTQVYDGHEEVSIKIAEELLRKLKYPEDKLAKVVGGIVATKMPQQPKNPLELSLCDADMAGLGKKGYFQNSERIRVEWEIAKQQFFSEIDWVNREIDFISKHEYHTAYAQKKYNGRKAKTLKKLQDRLSDFERGERILRTTLKKKSKQEVDIVPTKGIETMFRLTNTNHIRLSAIADNKANIMLSINAIIISITVSTLVPSFGDNPKLIMPTVVLLGVCITAIIFATLSTRPKITKGTFTEDDIKHKRSNLLFFGNFYNMRLEEFEWGMGEMMKDKSFLYGSMIKDLYFLGKVLDKKYRFLRICYNIFMYGLILAVLAFALSMFMPAPEAF